jgi:Raf kinase inhibitor-like YbhB/YbcL family protein
MAPIMKFASASFSDHAPIPAEFAFCAMDAMTHATLSSNRNPQFSWRDAPAGTKSFALICVDPDVPSKPDDVNKEGRIVPGSLPRVDFFHWVLIDIPATRNRIEAGEFSSCVTAKGKPGPDLPEGIRHGINDYTSWFAGDADMGGDYYGYDGPCPPWNDAIAHRYMFTLYALNVAQLELGGRITGADARAALKKHVLAEATMTGRYALNPAVKL